jgi:hypothetical protein
MTLTWAKVIAFFGSLVKPLIYAIIYFAGKKAATKEIEAEQAKQDAKLNSDYAEILADRPEPGESTSGMRRGDWPT